MSDLSADDVRRQRYGWLMGATIKELGFRPGTDVLTMVWVENKRGRRGVIHLQPDPELNDGGTQGD